MHTSTHPAPRSVLASFQANVCMPCSSGPSGKDGHGALRYVMLAPETERSFFRCGDCGERWIRSAGMTCRFTWTRYEHQSPSRDPGEPRTI
jgi:hypothetical protein